jgi:hypothetical protein
VIERSLAHPAPLITEALQDTTRENARAERGRRLFEERYNEIEHLENGCWLVPSSNLLNGSYIVSLRQPEEPRCECADHTYRGSRCYHIIAAEIADSKSRTCSCCGHRVLGRFTEEVTEDDGLLSWFPGDVLCADCIRKGFWG